MRTFDGARGIWLRPYTIGAGFARAAQGPLPTDGHHLHEFMDNSMQRALAMTRPVHLAPWFGPRLLVE